MTDTRDALPDLDRLMDAYAASVEEAATADMDDVTRARGEREACREALRA